jgi:tetratricopeptide (TPR) repeat protein
MTLNIKTKLIAYPLAFLCLYLTYQSFNIGFASLISVRPEQAIVAWEQKDRILVPQEAKAYQKRLESAIEHSPKNAFHKLWLGRLHLIMAKHSNKKQNLDAAKHWFEKSIEQIPTWYESWTYLAMAQLAQGESFDSINQSLEQALLLGPYEYSNQKLLIPLIMHNWESLSKSNQKQAKKILSHGLKYYSFAKIILDLTKDTGQFELVISLTSSKSHHNRIKKYQKELSTNVK